MSAKKSSKKSADPSPDRKDRAAPTPSGVDKESGSPGGKPADDRLPVVGIGASAGGLEALEEFFRNMPSDPGMVFVVVTHQHPGHTSLLPELLGKCTEMPVMLANDNLRLERNHVYVAPPGGHVAIVGAMLHLMQGPKGEIPPLPIDFFFRSLAQDQKDRAICIILSGTGTDGTLGLKAVKGEAGMAMVQEVPSARYAGMPTSAIATTLADYVLPPAAMPVQLLAYAATMSSYRRTPSETEKAPPQLKQPIQKVFVLLRARTGHDFSSYKPTTMRRRIERRMTVHRLTSPDEYVRLLQENPNEIDILFKQLLIGVTGFFRDPEAFSALAGQPLQELIRSRPDGYTLRVWVPGCGSGEEAYTIAILLRECMRQGEKSLDVQIFGTDLDAEAIETARSGQYPAGIAADVPPKLLKRYFTEESGRYCVRKEVREMLIFAPQNVIKDPPFTRIDLLCCRNLLIYFNTELQRRLLPIFHYTLKPEGLLMLGPSETIGEFGELFAVVDKKWKIYRRKETAAAQVPPEIPAQPIIRDAGRATATALDPVAKPIRISAEIEKLLINRFAPAAVITNERGDIIYLHGRTGMYLEPPTGQPSLNIHAMARKGLRIELAAAYRQAMTQDQEAARHRVRVKTNGEYTLVDLAVVRIAEPETVRGLLLVTFQPAPPPPTKEASTEKKGKAGEHPSLERAEQLERELQFTKESLQTTVEELETSNEELKSTNEELQSTNEELQSSNEELETSKEEMQSLNEELTTVNAELQSKVDDLSHANDDMQNLLNSTDVATIFLDSDLNIKRYTEQAEKVIKLIPTDIGRPVGDLVSNLHYDGLADDAQEVLRTLERKEIETESKDGTWYLMRIMPYRTAENVIEGLGITFIDISGTKAAEATAVAERSLLSLLQDTFDSFQAPALVLGEDLRVVRANLAFYRAFALNTEKIEGQLIYDVVRGEWELPSLRKLFEEVVPRQTAIENFEVQATIPGIGVRTFHLNARRIDREAGLPGMILLTMTHVPGER